MYFVSSLINRSVYSLSWSELRLFIKAKFIADKGLQLKSLSDKYNNRQPFPAPDFILPLLAIIS